MEKDFWKVIEMNKEEVIKRIGKENWRKFTAFMYGQTVKMKNGEVNYFSCDVDNFIAKMKGEPTFFD